MGVNSSKFQKTNTLQMIDCGSLIPLGLYEKNNDDYDLTVVRDLIVSKRLSPFYKGLSDPLTHDATVSTKQLTKKQTSLCRKKQDLCNNEKKLLSILYNDSIECPICFLYYPANINFARCCDQPICTACFVQIKKRPAPLLADASHSTNSVVLLCPYCMTDNFGVVYHGPPSSPTMHLEKAYKIRSTTSGISEHQDSKRKSIEFDHPNVVLLVEHVRSRQESDDATRNKSDMRAATDYWFQSARNSGVISLDRYISTIGLQDLSIQDIMAIEAMRQSLIDKTRHRRSYHQSYIF